MLPLVVLAIGVAVVGWYAWQAGWLDVFKSPHNAANPVVIGPANTSPVVPGSNTSPGVIYSGVLALSDFTNSNVLTVKPNSNQVWLEPKAATFGSAAQVFSYNPNTKLVTLEGTSNVLTATGTADLSLVTVMPYATALASTQQWIYDVSTKMLTLAASGAALSIDNGAQDTAGGSVWMYQPFNNSNQHWDFVTV